VASEATLESCKDWWVGTMSTRLNDPRQGARVVVMQRLDESDLSGLILEKDRAHEWEHLMLALLADCGWTNGLAASG
jgi:hypothetical protein